jgi:hypothetical protein
MAGPVVVVALRATGEREESQLRTRTVTANVSIGVCFIRWERTRQLRLPVSGLRRLALRSRRGPPDAGGLSV